MSRTTQDEDDRSFASVLLWSTPVGWLLRFMTFILLAITLAWVVWEDLNRTIEDLRGDDSCECAYESTAWIAPFPVTHVTSVDDNEPETISTTLGQTLGLD